MRMAVTTLVASLATLVLGIVSVQAAETSAGSGVVIGIQGEILTNSHVVEDCQKITVQFPSKDTETAVLVARDQKKISLLFKLANRSPRLPHSGMVPLFALAMP
jgi:S1-C subfamily serine protease